MDFSRAPTCCRAFLASALSFMSARSPGDGVVDLLGIQGQEQVAPMDHGAVLDGLEDCQPAPLLGPHEDLGCLFGLEDAVQRELDAERPLLDAVLAGFSFASVPSLAAGDGFPESFLLLRCYSTCRNLCPWRRRSA